ncbi:MAG TPA: twin-arginine translocase subunit TatC [Gammaproteobacteria bacterium]|nr:twin-arginine translocase subunit TatC [Gammaproteobacteria bacterium]
MTHQNNQDSALSNDTEQPLLYHLIELRNRLLRVVLVVGVVFIALVPFSNTLFTLLSGPLLAHMPDDSSMIAIEVASPFLIPFKLTLFLALFISIPYVLYQIWSFVAPGLYKHERRLVYPLLVSSTVLFYAGAAFAYFVVFPLVFAFFTSTAPEGVSVMTDISRYLDFVLTLFFAFGAAFEVPIFTILLVWTGVATQEGLREKRPYIIVGAFVIGMLLTPPDIISQTLLAVPVWLLFELGVYFSGWFIKQKESASNEAADASLTGYKPMSDDEMDAELDRMENEDKD